MLTMLTINMSAVGLQAKEVAYVRSLLLLFNYADRVKWFFVDHPPYDALMVAPSVTEEQVTALERAAGGACTVLRLQSGGVTSVTGQGDVIAYPIQAMQLKVWIQATEARMVQSALHSGLVIAPSNLFKLRRWPPVAVLQGSAANIRMATLLSKTHMDIQTLASISGLSEGACALFITQLRKANLLEEAVVSHADSQPQIQPAPSPAHSGLIGSIRRLLLKI